MSEGQLRVLIILLITFGEESLFSPMAENLINGFKGGFTTSGNQALASQLPATTVGAITYAVGIILLLILADAAPGVATILAVIILVSVTFRHAKDIETFISTAQTGLAALRKG